MATAIIKITQFDFSPGEGRVRDITSSASDDGRVRDTVAGASNSLLTTHLPAVSNPVPTSPAVGWPTGNKEDWSDSPTRQPQLLYRHRFGWGRDKLELFAQEGVPGTLSTGADGARWGKLTDVHGVLIYEELFPFSSEGRIHEFTVEDSGRILNSDSSLSNDLTNVRHLETITGEVDIELFPFIIQALPEPFSTKNPIDTDVFIRLSNFTFPISSGTITLELDEVQQSVLQIDEFFGGLGGFDITWNNNFLFEYDAQVDVRWEFLDTDSPASKTVIKYPFYTVSDLAPPRILNLVPSDEAVDVPIAGPIQFDIEDFENDVDIDSLILYVNNTLIVDGENGTLQITRLENKQGYTIRFTPLEAWLYGDLIPVTIFVKDTAKNKNERFFTYSFTTIQSDAPRLINLKPAACAIDVPVRTHISADIIDGGHGLDKDSIVFTVEEVERSGSVIILPVIHRDD